MHDPKISAALPGAGERRLPKAPSWPVVGSLPGFFADPYRFAVETRRERGDIYRLDLGVLEVIALCHPRHAHHVLRDRARIYVKGGALMESMRAVVGEGLVLSEGEHWRRQRRMIQPHFNRKNLAAMATGMVEVIDGAMSRWDDLAASGRPFDVLPELSAITMQVIVRTLFGAAIDEAEIRTVGDAMAEVQRYIPLGAMFKSLPAWLPRPGRRRFQRSLAAIEEIVGRFIARQRRGLGQEGTFVATLVDAVDASTGARMSDDQIRDEAVTMFLAGYETTSLSIAWALHYLAGDPAFAAQMAAEIELELGASAPSLADLPRLTCTQQALKEALRLSGPVFWTWRTATEDDEIDGYAVPAGSTVALVLHAMNRHPDLWSSPDTFDPRRFAASGPAGADSAWVPFGAGQRQCIGLDFAMIEGQLLLTRVAQRFRLATVPDRAPRLRLATTSTVKDGIWLRLARRDDRPTTR